MKKLLNFMVIVLAALLLLPLSSAFSQASKVPITYPGDTDETIARRAEWMEGAEKEGKLVWWGSAGSNQAVTYYWSLARYTLLSKGTTDEDKLRKWQLNWRQSLLVAVMRMTLL